MMHGTFTQTPHADINAVLRYFLVNIQAIAGQRLRGMYLSGSLALGDFNPASSDIDFVVVTDVTLSDEHVAALRAMHDRFAESTSPWAAKIEAVYIPQAALHPTASTAALYPQVEKDRPLFMDQLESGWAIQCATLREHGIVLAGPDPRILIDPVDPDNLRRASAAIVEDWLDHAHHDLEWVIWLRSHYAFVVLTLCRILYTLDVGAVASKPAAARWAEQALEPRWADLIACSNAGLQESEETAQSAVTETIALIQYTHERFRQWARSSEDAPA